MSATSIASVIFACVFGGALAGMFLRAVLPEHHVNKDSKDMVMLGTGLIGTMAALVLGLLVASTKSRYDSESNELTEMTANVVLLDRVLAHYGTQTEDARESLRRVVAGVIDGFWSTNGSHPSPSAPLHSDGFDLFDRLHQLSPANDEQRSLRAAAQSIATDLGKTRLLLFAQMSSSSISMPFVVVVVFWLTTIFVSFGLFAPRNATVIVTLLVCALSVSGAVFLILELDHPFHGLIQISSDPMRAALAHLGR